MEIEIINKWIGKVCKYKNGIWIISSDDFNNFTDKLNENDKNLVIKIIENNGIKLQQSLIKKEDRPSKVNEFDYGEVTSNDMNNIDQPEYAEIIFDEQNNRVYSDFRDLENYLIKEFIPNNIAKKKRANLNKEYEFDSEGYYLSIQLNKIVALRLSEEEFRYTINFLNENGIHVGGILSDLQPEFTNYDFVRTYKDSRSPDVLPIPLSAEEQKELLIKYNEFEDRECKETIEIRNKLINSNLRLVRFIASRYAGYTKLSVHELESYGYEGLIYAINHFDIKRDNKFITYAYSCIRGYILSGIPEIQGFRKSHAYETFINIKKAVELALSDDYGRNIRIEEYPEFVDEILEFLRENKLMNDGNIDEINCVYSLSLDEILECNSDLGIPDPSCASVEELVEGNALKDEITFVLSTLTDRENSILRLLYGLDIDKPLSHRQIAERHGICSSRVEQIVAKAIRKLRHPSRSNRLIHFL